MSAIEPRTRAEFIAEELRRRIVSGALPAGTRLRQVEVAEQFRVSTTPVREAFTSLAREGLVRHDAHKGAVVFRPTLDDVRENYEIRIALESLAAELAAKEITTEELERVTALHEAMLKPISRPRGVELNREFHRAIYTAAHRDTLFQMIERLRDAAAPYVQVLAAHYTDDYAAAVRREHAEIVAALAAHAPRRAHKAMTAHLRHNLQEIGSQMEGLTSVK